MAWRPALLSGWIEHSALKRIQHIGYVAARFSSWVTALQNKKVCKPSKASRSPRRLKSTASSQGQVQGKALAGSAACFISLPQAKRIFSQRVTMQTDKKQVGALLKNALRAVAVVVVHIPYCNALAAKKIEPIGVGCMHVREKHFHAG
jgi:hypothetical protein